MKYFILLLSTLLFLTEGNACDTGADVSEKYISDIRVTEDRGQMNCSNLEMLLNPRHSKRYVASVMLLLKDRDGTSLGYIPLSMMEVGEGYQLASFCIKSTLLQYSEVRLSMGTRGSVKFEKDGGFEVTGGPLCIDQIDYKVPELVKTHKKSFSAESAQTRLAR